MSHVISEGLYRLTQQKIINHFTPQGHLKFKFELAGNFMNWSEQRGVINQQSQLPTVPLSLPQMSAWFEQVTLGNHVAK
jgi:hypothetical protein